MMTVIPPARTNRDVISGTKVVKTNETTKFWPLPCSQGVFSRILALVICTLTL